ncbi:MAG: MBL fold metallo-hydrolase [Nitrospirae bacterium]|nr:MBL fold metallo-hydrolase [Nitrospirota bacterium]
MLSHELFNNARRRWVYFGKDPKRPQTLIDTNQYLIVNDEKGLLPDPGGLEIFPSMISALSKEIEMDNVESIFASHQDPDICSSLSLWLSVCKNLQAVYVPWVWSMFIPHFGGGRELTSVPDEGTILPLGGSNDLKLIPAHYLHSSGNFSLYDPVAKILFSGDIGAALLPPDYDDIFVKDFNNHIQYMEGFHKRWMPSNVAKNKWIGLIRKLDINLMCPQHGAIFKKTDIQKFLDWFEQLNVGIAV